MVLITNVLQWKITFFLCSCISYKMTWSLIKEGRDCRLQLNFWSSNYIFILRPIKTRLQDIVHLVYFYYSNNTFYEVHFIEIDQWTLPFSDVLRHSAKFIGGMCFSSMSWFDQNITFFASSFIAMVRSTNLFFVFKNKNYCYLYCFYHEWAFDLLIWLIG